MKVDGTKVKKARLAVGMSVTLLASRIDMSATWLYAVEGKDKASDIREPIVKALAKELKVKEKELEFDKEVLCE